MKSSALGVDIPADVLEKWQSIVDLLAEIMHVPAAVVVKIDPPDAQIFVTSSTRGNPFERGALFNLSGLYCEKVVNTRRLLQVPNALLDEEWALCPDVKVGMISYLGYPIVWPDGEVFGTICVLDGQTNEYNEAYRKLLLSCRDVLQADLRSLAELGEELATKKAHLNELFVRVPEAIVLLDADDHILRVNPEFTAMFGYAEEEVVGRSLNDLIAPGDRLREAEVYRQRVTDQGETVTEETVRRHKNGAPVSVSIVAVPVAFDGARSSEYVIFRDITQRKRLESELKYERDRLRLLLEITTSVTSRLDLRQLIEALSTNLLKVMRCDVSALLLPDPDSAQLRVTILYNPDVRGPMREGKLIPMKSSISGKVFRTAKSIRIDSFEKLRDDPEIFGNPEGQWLYERILEEGLRSGCYLPLAGRDRVLGVLMITKRSEDAFATDDLTFLEQVARQVAIGVENALDYGKATEDRDKEKEEKLYLQEEIRSDRNFGEIIGESAALKAALHQVSVVAPTDSTVLILGETGTGKELIARAIHDLSARRERPFVKINCAAIPLGLLESELFGHERGAFTGAISQKKGRFELANKGTLFLDELGDIPLELQAKLLRILQEHEFERLGSNHTHKVDVRIIAATHRELAKMVKQHAFREDLFYRLNVFPVQIPALRERSEDIPLLARHFACQYARRMSKTIEEIPVATLDALVRYRWPGNVRELQNFMERAVILSPGSVLKAPVAELLASDSVLPEGEPTSVLERLERDHIERVLDQSNWVVGGPNGAAAKLGIKRTSLIYKMQKLGISRAASADR